MRESKVLKRTPALSSRIVRASRPAAAKTAPRTAKAPPTKAAQQKPEKPAKAPAKSSPVPISRAVTAFDATAFEDFDQAAAAALRSCKRAWLSESNAERARDRFCEFAERSLRPALLIGPSLSALLRERARLMKLGFKAIVLDSQEGRIARAELEALRRGGALLVLATTDVLARAEVQAALARVEFGSVAIDAAELASAQGHEFRPGFARLPELITGFANAALFALSRPVRAEVRARARDALGLAHAALVDAPPVSPEIRLEARAVRGERRNATLLSLLPDLPERGVILCATPHDVDALCAVIGAEHGSVCRIHAAMPAADRARMLERFESGSGRALLVTTSALAPDAGFPGLGETAASEPRVGFGLDTAAELGFVLHHHAPASLEQYVREVASLRSSGAVALMFYDSSHRSMNQAILEQQRLPAHKVEPFARALEASLAAGRPVKHEALALQTGISRRTSERLIALFADAGLVQRDGQGIALQKANNEREKRYVDLAGALASLAQSDSARLVAVERYAESGECKRRALAQYFGTALTANCGHCDGCRSRGHSEQKANSR